MKNHNNSFSDFTAYMGLITIILILLAAMIGTIVYVFTATDAADQKFINKQYEQRNQKE